MFKGKRGMLLGMLLVLSVVFYAVNLMPVIAATTFVNVDGIGTGVQTSGFWANGGSYMASKYEGAYVEFTFNGTAVSLLTILYSNRGLADVTIDGTSSPAQGCVYTPFDTFVASGVVSTPILLAEGLSPGNHTVRITVSENHSVGSTDSWVVVDGFVYGQTTAEAAEYMQRLEAGDVPVYLVEVVDNWYSGGSYWFSLGDIAGNYAELTFIGTAVDLIAVLWTNRGLADVTIDGTSTPEQGQVNTPIDQYGVNAVGNPVYDVRIPLASGLSPGVHTVRITVKGESSPSNTSIYNGVTVDAFEYKTVALVDDNLPPVVKGCALIQVDGPGRSVNNMPSASANFRKVEIGTADDCGGGVASISASIDGIKVSDGELVKISIDPTRADGKVSQGPKGYTHIIGPTGILKVTATDVNGNVGTCEVTP